MDDHVSRILKMLEEGKISAAEAEKLIAALRTEPTAGAAGTSESKGHAETPPGTGADPDAERASKSFEFRWSRKGSFPFDLSDLGRQITDAIRKIDPERIAKEARVSVERESRRWRDRMRDWGKFGEGETGRPENQSGQPVARATETLDFEVGATGTIQVENNWGEVIVTGGAERVTVAVEKEAWAATQEEAEAKLRELKVEAAAVQATGDGPSRLEVKVTAPPGWHDGVLNLRLHVPTAVTADLATVFGDVRVEQTTGSLSVRSVSGSVVLDNIGAPGGSSAVRVETISGEIRATGAQVPLKLTSKSGDVYAKGLAQGGELVTVSGDVRAVSVEGAKLEGKSVSGDVIVEDVGTAAPVDIAVESVSGDVSLARARGTVLLKTVSGDMVASALDAATIQAQTVSGDIRLGTGSAFTGTLTCNTVSGDVAANLSPAGGFRFTLGTQSGDLHCSYTVQDESRTDTLWTGSVGSGEGTVTVQTRSGDIRLDSAE